MLGMGWDGMGWGGVDRRLGIMGMGWDGNI